MTGLTAIIRKEVKNLLGSGWGIFVIYAVIAVVWSLMLFYQYGAGVGGGVWLVFFAVIVAANFSGTVFISERVNGTLEVLIVSGVSRDAVLFGKMFFVAGATLAMGAVCAALSVVWVCLLSDAGWASAVSRVLGSLAVQGALLYFGATVLNVSASAYLSVRMSNPRFLHFASLFMTGAIMAVYGAFAAAFGERPIILALAFLALGAVFAALARREFAGERITRPVIF